MSVEPDPGPAAPDPGGVVGPGGPPSELRGAQVRLRPVERVDAPVLRAFLDEPEVGRWWPPPPADEDFPFDEEGAVVLTIVVDGVVAGLVQYAEELEPDYRHASVDVVLGTAFHGRGLGPDAVATVVRHLVLDRGHHRVTIDPAVGNVRAIAAYQRVGFRPVGILRRYERDHATGGWRDGLLMDLLAEDVGLVPGPVPSGCVRRDPERAGGAGPGILSCPAEGRGIPPRPARQNRI